MTANAYPVFLVFRNTHIMNRALSRFFLSGVLSFGSVGLAIPAFAQCGCATGMNNGSVVYQSSDLPYELSADALLDDSQEDPMSIANLRVIVHDKAIVKVNGEETITMGTARPYIVRGLKAGKSYKFDIVAVLRQPKGDVYVAKQEVILKGGESKEVVLKVKRANRAEFEPKPNPVVSAPAAVSPAIK
jgi:uncharacterized protein (TIGR03000 family)